MRTQFILFSAESDKNTREQNETSISVCRFVLTDLKIPYKEVDGCYKGVKERSFLVEARFEHEVVMLSKMFKQESILFVDRKRNAYLTFLDKNETVKLDGKFEEVDNTIGLDAYTVDLDSGKQYAIR